MLWQGSHLMSVEKDEPKCMNIKKDQEIDPVN